MVQTFAMALLVNHYQYQGNQLEVTQAENDDVVQFLVVLTKENEDNFSTEFYRNKLLQVLRLCDGIHLHKLNIYALKKLNPGSSLQSSGGKLCRNIELQDLKGK